MCAICNNVSAIVTVLPELLEPEDSIEEQELAMAELVEACEDTDLRGMR